MTSIVLIVVKMAACFKNINTVEFASLANIFN